MMEHVEMGREVRMVPADWKHPTQEGFYSDGSIRYSSLFDGSDFEARAADWDEEAAKWDRGEFPSYAEDSDKAGSYAEWAGDRPDPSDYMPNWPEAERTHYMMYETTSEGSPISPAFATPEELAKWLADNGASSFGASTASYESWLRVCKGGWAPSAVVDAHGIRSGVEALGDKAAPE
jgi:hypothetical protein